MYGKLLLKKWIKQLLVTDEISVKSTTVKNLGHKFVTPEGDVVKLVTDGEFAISALFYRNAVHKALEELDDCSETDWNSALLILTDFKVDLMLRTDQKSGEYVLLVSKFKIWNLQPGYSHKERVTLCMDCNEVKDKMQKAIKERTEKDNGAIVANTSASISQLLEAMTDASTSINSSTRDCELTHNVSHITDTSNTHARAEDNLMEKLLAPFTSEEFFIQPHEEKVLADISEWCPGYVLPASTEGSTVSEQFDRPAENASTYSSQDINRNLLKGGNSAKNEGSDAFSDKGGNSAENEGSDAFSDKGGNSANNEGSDAFSDKGGNSQINKGDKSRRGKGTNSQSDKEVKSHKDKGDNLQINKEDKSPREKSHKDKGDNSSMDKSSDSNIISPSPEAIRRAVKIFSTMKCSQIARGDVVAADNSEDSNSVPVLEQSLSEMFNVTSPKYTAQRVSTQKAKFIGLNIMTNSQPQEQPALEFNLSSISDIELSNEGVPSVFSGRHNSESSQCKTNSNTRCGGNPAPVTDVGDGQAQIGDCDEAENTNKHKQSETTEPVKTGQRENERNAVEDKRSDSVQLGVQPDAIKQENIQNSQDDSYDTAKTSCEHSESELQTSIDAISSSSDVDIMQDYYATKSASPKQLDKEYKKRLAAKYQRLSKTAENIGDITKGTSKEKSQMEISDKDRSSSEPVYTAPTSSSTIGPANNAVEKTGLTLSQRTDDVISCRETQSANFSCHATQGTNVSHQSTESSTDTSYPFSSSTRSSCTLELSNDMVGSDPADQHLQIIDNIDIVQDASAKNSLTEHNSNTSQSIQASPQCGTSHGSPKCTPPKPKSKSGSKQSNDDIRKGDTSPPKTVSKQLCGDISKCFEFQSGSDKRSLRLRKKIKEAVLRDQQNEQNTVCEVPSVELTAPTRTVVTSGVITVDQEIPAQAEDQVISEQNCSHGVNKTTEENRSNDASKALKQTSSNETNNKTQQMPGEALFVESVEKVNVSPLQKPCFSADKEQQVRTSPRTKSGLVNVEKGQVSPKSTSSAVDVTLREIVKTPLKECSVVLHDFMLQMQNLKTKDKVCEDISGKTTNSDKEINKVSISQIVANVLRKSPWKTTIGDKETNTVAVNPNSKAETSQVQSVTNVRRQSPRKTTNCDKETNTIAVNPSSKAETSQAIESVTNVRRHSPRKTTNSDKETNTIAVNPSSIAETSQVRQSPGKTTNCDKETNTIAVNPSSKAKTSQAIESVTNVRRKSPRNKAAHVELCEKEGVNPTSNMHGLSQAKQSVDIEMKESTSDSAEVSTKKVVPSPSRFVLDKSKAKQSVDTELRVGANGGAELSKKDSLESDETPEPTDINKEAVESPTIIASPTSAMNSPTNVTVEAPTIIASSASAINSPSNVNDVILSSGEFTCDIMSTQPFDVGHLYDSTTCRSTDNVSMEIPNLPEPVASRTLSKNDTIVTSTATVVSGGMGSSSHSNEILIATPILAEQEDNNVENQQTIQESDSKGKRDQEMVLPEVSLSIDENLGMESTNKQSSRGKSSKDIVHGDLSNNTVKVAIVQECKESNSQGEVTSTSLSTDDSDSDNNVLSADEIWSAVLSDYYKQMDELKKKFRAPSSASEQSSQPHSSQRESSPRPTDRQSYGRRASVKRKASKSPISNQGSLKRKAVAESEDSDTLSDVIDLLGSDSEMDTSSEDMDGDNSCETGRKRKSLTRLKSCERLQPQPPPGNSRRPNVLSTNRRTPRPVDVNHRLTRTENTASRTPLCSRKQQTDTGNTAPTTVCQHTQEQAEQAHSRTPLRPQTKYTDNTASETSKRPHKEHTELTLLRTSPRKKSRNLEATTTGRAPRHRDTQNKCTVLSDTTSSSTCKDQQKKCQTLSDNIQTNTRTNKMKLKKRAPSEVTANTNSHSRTHKPNPVPHGQDNSHKSGAVPHIGRPNRHTLTTASRHDQAGASTSREGSSSTKIWSSTTSQSNTPDWLQATNSRSGATNSRSGATNSRSGTTNNRSGATNSRPGSTTNSVTIYRRHRIVLRNSSQSSSD